MLHGEDDQIVPVKISAMNTVRLINDATEVHYRGAPRGPTVTHQERVNAGLLAFIRR